MRVLFLHLISVLAAVTCLAQTQPQPPARPPSTLAPGSAALQAPRLAPTNQDLFNALIGSAASIDLDAPIAVRAEFDPQTIPVGGRVLYRIVLTALDESVKLPDQLPTPAGLQLTPGGRGQAYQPLAGH